MEILIADDERNARYSLQSMLEELYPNEHIYYQAENGMELIDLVSSKSPDIAFVDVKMPKMDGLSALKAAKEKSPGTIFLILSGFAEFDFAKQAMRLGAENYLLKPVSRDELAEVMKHLTTSSKERIKTENNEFRLKVVTAFNAYQALGQQLDDEPDNDFLFMFVFYFDNWNHEVRNRMLTDLTDCLHNHLTNDLLIKQYQFAIFFQPNGELCMVVKKKPSEKVQDNLIKFVSEILLRFDRQITAFFCEDNSLKELFAQGQRVLSLSCVRSVYHFGQVIELVKLENLQIFFQLIQFSETLERLCISYVEKDPLAFNDELGQFRKSEDMKKAFKEVDADSLKCYLDTSLRMEVQTNNFSEFVGSFYSNAESVFKDRTREKSDVIGIVKKYIEAHYSEQIGINTISELLDITPNYLSKIFHEHSGEKFMDYLTRVRVDNAKLLLSQHPDFTIKKISESVGYLSAQYFIKIFFKMTGYLPSEYQKRFS